MEQEARILEQFAATLASLNTDASFLQDENFTFDQKFVLYRSARHGHNLANINDPNIPPHEMEAILDEQLDMLKNLRRELNIDTKKYNFEHIRELHDAMINGLDISLYKSHEFSAEHMHIAKTFQQEGLPGIEQIHPDKSIEELTDLRQDIRQKHSTQQEHNPPISTSIETTKNLLQKKTQDTIENNSEFVETVSPEINSKYIISDPNSSIKVGVNTNQEFLDYVRKLNPLVVEQIEAKGFIESKGNGILYLNQEHPPTLAKLISLELKLDLSCNSSKEDFERPNQCELLDNSR